MFWELFELPAIKVQTVLTHVILMALEEVKHEVLDLRAVRNVAKRVRICHLLGISLS
jgi:hypothetical protein